MSLLEIEGVDKAFDGQHVLRNVSLDVQLGEILVLLGPSGCGKTTLLRIVAGLEQPDRGRVLLDGADLSQTPIHQRGFGMVFQDYALFPHKNVFDNVVFGLRMQSWPEPKRRQRVQQVLELVGMPGFGRRAVYDLSGGEQQRVALARALAPSPRLLLLDEPLGSLDRALRERLMGDLRSILKDAAEVTAGLEGVTAIYVTHDQEEAFALADRVVVMNRGAIEQSGQPMALYRRPRNAFVARFLGMDNLVSARIVSSEPPTVTCGLGKLRVVGLAGKKKGDEVMLLVRPGAGKVVGEQEADNLVEGTLTRTSFRGRHQVAHLAVRSNELETNLKLEFDSTTCLPRPGETLRIVLDSERLLVLE